MPTTLTETASFGASVDVPASGEARTAASINPAFQELTNRSAWTKSALNGLIVGRRELYTDSTGAGTDVFVAPIPRIVLGSRALSLDVATEAPTPGGGLVASTWYYVYAYDSSGVLALETTTSAPEATLTWKTGTTTHRYLGCFRTATSGAALPFRSIDGRFVFRTSGASVELIALTDNTANAATDLALAFAGSSNYLIPAHARLARLRSSLAATGGDAVAEFLTKGDAGTTMRQESLDGQNTDVEFTIEGDSSRTIQYVLTLAGTGTLVVRVVGFEE